MLFAALAKNAGAIAVALEPRGWDEGGAYDKHKRPDIEWINAATRRFTITDVTIDWTMTVGSGMEHAEGAEKRKVDAYKTAMQRNHESAARARRQPDDFAPLGFAKNGAWGPQAQRIFKDLCAMLSVRTMSADLYGWSAMTFEKHWLQRIGVTQARARAALLTEGVRSRQQAACEVKVTKKDGETYALGGSSEMADMMMNQLAATVQDQARSAHIGRHRRGKKDAGFPYVRWVCETPKGNGRFHASERGGISVVKIRFLCFHHANGHCIDPHAWRPFDG